MKDEIEILLLQFDDERGKHRKREAFLTSVVFHLLLIIFILVSPKLFPKKSDLEISRRRMSDMEREKELGFLALPKDYQKLFQKPKAPVLSDKDRFALGKAPTIDPKGLRVPYSKGDTKMPEQSSPPGPPQPPATPPPSPQQQQAPPPDENKQIAKLQLPQTPNQDSGLHRRSLREISEGLETPGIKSSIEKARQAGSYGTGGLGGDSIRNFDNRQPNFTVDEPTILTDTQGVDFGSWLRQIYFRVRDNWYPVIPEIIRSGTKGRVVIIFDVRSNGRIENLQVVRGSGLPSYDRAAISSLKLSEPFPNFPPAFNKDFITLQFTYLYNMRL